MGVDSRSFFIQNKRNSSGLGRADAELENSRSPYRAQKELRMQGSRKSF